VPVPDLVAWDEIGDGTIFNAMALSGDPPDVVWRDRDRVRDQYRQAVDYAHCASCSTMPRAMPPIRR
jgi:hypothetical protein